ncbi:MAG TPA: type IV toxin-antitoxin system AbiEi family antitoxin domain-containing protein [Acidimicrobiales bacterium]|nr:type IV toxin-antitoxin system AbiEi family antitoxin domain-containing protein [Acidimicrobiales bacterium]
MANTDVDQAVAQLACRQQGLFSRRQALAHGANPSLVQRRLASGRWLTVGRGVYAMPGVPLSWERRQAAACMAAGPAAVLSHRAAAALHGFPDCRQGAPEITVPWTVATHHGHGRIHRATDLAGTDVVVVRGIRVTKRLRTLLDLAAVVSTSKLAAVLDDLVAARVVALEEVVTAAGVYARRGKTGSTALRQVLSERGPGYVPPESELERRLLSVMRAGGLPTPARQHPLPALAGGGRVDVAYPERRLLIEGDGRRWHTKPASTKADRERDNEAAALGWRTLRFGWDDLLTRPAWVCQVVRCCLSGAA